MEDNNQETTKLKSSPSKGKRRRISLTDLTLSLPCIRTRKSESDVTENQLTVSNIEDQKKFSKSDNHLVVKRSRWTSLRCKEIFFNHKIRLKLSWFLITYRHSLAFIRKGKEKCEESRKSSALLDESLKDEIRLLHGSVFDLYLDSLNIREAKYQDIV